MAKNKLLTIPIELEKRERLNQHCADRGIKVTELITRYIDRVLAGGESEGTISPSDSSPVVTESFINQIETSISNAIQFPLYSLPTEFRELHVHQRTNHDSLQKIWTDVDERLNLLAAEVKRLEAELDRRVYSIQSSIDTSIDKPDTLTINLTIPSTLEAIPNTSQDLSTLPTHEYLDSLTPPTDKPIDIPIDNHIDTIVEPETSKTILTIDDTMQVLRDKLDQRRTTPYPLNKITLQEIADHLRICNYPHPHNRKWTRTEVPKMAKEWAMQTEPSRKRN